MSDPYADGDGPKIRLMLDPYADGKRKIWLQVRSKVGPEVGGRCQGLIQVRTFFDLIDLPKKPLRHQKYET